MTTPGPVDDLIRATLHAQAGSVREVGPPRLPDAALTPRGAPRPRRVRRWAPWLAPLTAAAVVICVAIALVTIKSIANAPAVSPSPTAPASSASPPVPKYYVAVARVGHSLLIGDTYTGKTVATLPAPPGITFFAVTAAADDRTFVLDAQPANGSRTWYLLRIAPGTASPARLTKLPIPATTPSNTVYALALSASGQELALLTAARIATGIPGKAVLQVYSVATGQLLHAWQTRHFLDALIPMPGADNTTALVWAANDTAIAFTTWTGDANGSHKIATLRLFDVRSASGADWVSAGRKVLSLNVPEQTQTNYPCYLLTLVPDGTGVACATEEGDIERGWPTTVRWLEYSADSPRTPRVVGQERYIPKASKTASGSVRFTGLPIGVYWSDPTGSTLLVATGYVGSVSVNFGIAHDGTYTPLPLPAPAGSANIAW
jgi:hypothetical protein